MCSGEEGKEREEEEGRGERNDSSEHGSSDGALRWENKREQRIAGVRGVRQKNECKKESWKSRELKGLPAGSPALDFLAGVKSLDSRFSEKDDVLVVAGVWKGWSHFLIG